MLWRPQGLTRSALDHTDGDLADAMRVVPLLFPAGQTSFQCKKPRVIADRGASMFV
jgi:hypothetical protein